MRVGLGVGEFVPLNENNIGPISKSAKTHKKHDQDGLGGSDMKVFFEG